MNVPFFIAKRYLFAKKSHNIINFISIVSLVGITIATSALLIVLSIFNGLQDFVSQSLNAFNSDIEITPKEGKVFDINTINIDSLAEMDNILSVSGVLSDVVVFVHDERQYIAYIKGVDNNYFKINRLDTMIHYGKCLLNIGEHPLAILGGDVAYRLNCNLENVASNYIKVYYPNRSRKTIGAMPGLSSLNSQVINPSGIFYTFTEYDSKYVFVPIDFARQLLAYESVYTSIEMKCKSGKITTVKQYLEKKFGQSFFVKDAYQQEEEIYKVMQTEKWSIYAILSFILLIAAFNIVGMMSILILEKKSQINVFYAMGVDKTFIQKIFLNEGLLITSIGMIIGLLLGLLFCFLQAQFGLISFGDGAYLIDAYPIHIKLTDVLLIFTIVILITFPAIYIPIRKMVSTKTHYNE